VWDRDRLSFGALQQRLVNPAAKAACLAAARTASFVAFDLLAVGRRDLRRHTRTARRAALEHLSAGWAPPLQLSPVTADVAEAQEWMSLYYQAGIEGIVAKDAESTYRQGQRVWSKVKHRETLEIIVGAVIGPAHCPTAVIGARYDGDDLVVIGRTGDLTPTQARELGPLIRASADHPWPPTTTSGRWGSSGAAVAWTRVEPCVVVEVAADAARQGVQYRHPLALRPPPRRPLPRRRRTRTDLT